MKIKYILIPSAIVLAVMIGGLFVLNYIQTKDFERLPKHIPYSQLQEIKKD